MISLWKVFIDYWYIRVPEKNVGGMHNFWCSFEKHAVFASFHLLYMHVAKSLFAISIRPFNVHFFLYLEWRLHGKLFSNRSNADALQVDSAKIKEILSLLFLAVSWIRDIFGLIRIQATTVLRIRDIFGLVRIQATTVIRIRKFFPNFFCLILFEGTFTSVR